MPAEDRSEQTHNFWTEIQRQQREGEEAYEPSRKNRQQKMYPVHLRHCRTQHEKLEWHRRREHPWEHQRPEFMPLKRGVNALESFLGNTLAQNLLSAEVPDEVERNAPD